MKGYGKYFGGKARRPCGWIVYRTSRRRETKNNSIFGLSICLNIGGIFLAEEDQIWNPDPKVPFWMYKVGC